MVFTGKTKNLGVIGYPIKHSLSPVIQNTAIQEAGIDYAYIAMRMDQKEFARCTRQWRREQPVVLLPWK